MNKKILILGGYGNFGNLIARSLARRMDVELIIAGRNRQKADWLCESLKNNGTKCQLSSLVIDIHSDSFKAILVDSNPYMIIHTIGPFQGQEYTIPRICIESGIHYIDLADDRRYVCDFSSLDALAKQHQIIAISGASSVPGLSSVVIDNFQKKYSEIETIEIAIIPGSNVDLGEATMKGFLSGLGLPFESWINGKYRQCYGWLDIRRCYFGIKLGKRWLANVNIPDLELFPNRYQDVKTVRFQAGHELSIIHLSLALIAYLTRLGLYTHSDRYSHWFYQCAQILKKLGSDTGGMEIQIKGKDLNGKHLSTTWRLIAGSGNGPRIPTIPTVILTDKILYGKLTEPGAYPCLGMFDVDEFLTTAADYGIYAELEQSNE